MSRLISDYIISLRIDTVELCHILMLASLTGQANDKDRWMLGKWVKMVVKKLKKRGLEIPEDLTYHFPDCTHVEIMGKLANEIVNGPIGRHFKKEKK